MNLCEYRARSFWRFRFLIHTWNQSYGTSDFSTLEAIQWTLETCSLLVDSHAEDRSPDNFFLFFLIDWHSFIVINRGLWG